MKNARSLMLAAIFSPLALSAHTQQNPSTMPRIGSVDERFQSYNVEMVEVIGGRFWRPYASHAAATSSATGTPTGTPGGIDPVLFEQRTPIDLSNVRLRKLAAALGPAYIRVSGTWANTVYFQDSDAPAPAKPPQGFGGVLTRAQWKGVLDFSKAVDGRIVTSFSTGMGTRDASGLWTPVEGTKFLDATRALGGTIAAAEFMNEPTFISAAGAPKGYDGAAYGRDWAVFQPFLRKASPGTLVLGPGSVGEGIDMMPAGRLLPSHDLLEAMGANAVDRFSYHYYGGVSERCGSAMGGKGTTSPEAALTDDWLGRTGRVEMFYAGLRDQYAPGKDIWLTETGQTACGGDRWAAMFLDTFRYLDQNGALARRGVKVMMHNTLAASDYALIDEKTLTPRPNYWGALLWHRLMGVTVLDPGAATLGNVHVYAHCMKDQPGGVALLVLNLDRMSTKTLPLAQPAMRYTLTATEPMSRSVKLNGRELELAPSGDVPATRGVPVKGSVELPPVSVTFLAFPAARHSACH